MIRPLFALIVIAAGLNSALCGCALVDGSRADEARITIRFEGRDYESTAQPARTVERPWSARKLWALDRVEDSRPLVLRVTFDPPAGSSQSHVAMLPQQAVGGRAADSPVVLTIDLPGGSFTFTGAPTREPQQWAGDRGTVRLTFQPQFIAASQRLDPRPSIALLLQFVLTGAEAGTAEALAALRPPPSLPQAVRLVETGVSAVDIERLRQAGYNFTFEEHILMHGHGVSVEDAVAYRREGFDLSAAKLIRLHEARVEPQYAAQMRRLGVAHTDEDVLVLHQRRISPRGVAMFQQAGYMLTRDELVQVSARGVTADEAFALKNIGYDFSIDDLMKLRQWEVPTDYVIALWSDDFRPLAADQIVELRLRRITPEMVQAMRQHNAASHETLATPSPDPAAPPRPLSEADLEALRKALEP